MAPLSANPLPGTGAFASHGGGEDGGDVDTGGDGGGRRGLATDPAATAVEQSLVVEHPTAAAGSHGGLWDIRTHKSAGRAALAEAAVSAQYARDEVR